MKNGKIEDIKLFIKLFPKWFFYSFIYNGYYLEAVWQRLRDKDYIGRYVHPITKAERFLFSNGNLAGGLKNSARVSLCIPDKPIISTPLKPHYIYLTMKFSIKFLMKELIMMPVTD